ncbi:MAG: hypothetical protein QXD04_02940 [Candidatus Bathyarchaeia archaeon]
MQRAHEAGGRREKEAEKLGENRYRVRKVTFTTCDARPAPWKFTAEELEVTWGGSGIAKAPKFYVYDIPLIYTPVVFFPVKKLLV